TLLTCLAMSCGVAQQDQLLDTPETADEVNPSRSLSGSRALTMANCGTALASFDGTVAYSNGANTGTGVSCGGVGGYGYRYQCVELVMRHFKTHWGLRWYGNAKDLLNNAPSASVDVRWNGDGEDPPVPGDMVVWRSGTYGHVALVTAVRSGEIDIVEQNVSGNGQATLPWDGASIGARWGNWVPAGWAHAKANGSGTTTPPPPPPPPPAVNWSCASSAYNGGQLWTCSSGSLYQCQGGVAVKQSCEQGCVVRPLGSNDLCISNASGWSCADSAYNGQQLWTCSTGKLYRCSNGVSQVVACPSGCTVRPTGTNDYCS
ncbi:MAG: CHAP domain-containing protein, partial [Myxococcaceae bacterium]